MLLHHNSGKTQNYLYIRDDKTCSKNVNSSSYYRATIALEKRLVKNSCRFKKLIIYVFWKVTKFVGTLKGPLIANLKGSIWGICRYESTLWIILRLSWLNDRRLNPHEPSWPILTQSERQKPTMISNPSLETGHITHITYHIKPLKALDGHVSLCDVIYRWAAFEVECKILSSSILASKEIILRIHSIIYSHEIMAPYP